MRIPIIFIWLMEMGKCSSIILSATTKSSPADLNTIQRKTNILHWSEETCAQKSNVFSLQFEMNAEERLVKFGDSQKNSEGCSYCEACLEESTILFLLPNNLFSSWSVFDTTAHLPFVQFMFAKTERKENASFRLFLTSFGCFGCVQVRRGFN